MPKREIRPSNLELQVLGALWDHGDSTAREVLERLTDGKKRAYTTVLSTLQGLEKKGLVEISDTRGNAHVYCASKPREEVVRPILGDLVRHALGGSPAAALQQLLGSGDVSPEELAEIRSMIDKAESRVGRRKGRKP